jgi:hypothetical protein
MPDDATFPAGKQHCGREAIGFAGSRGGSAPLRPPEAPGPREETEDLACEAALFQRDVWGGCSWRGGTDSAADNGGMRVVHVRGSHSCQYWEADQPRRANGAADSELAFPRPPTGADGHPAARDVGPSSSRECGATPGYQRYLALPLTTPECDSLLAWHSRGANPCSSHHAFASSAVMNRWLMTVTQNWPS